MISADEEEDCPPNQDRRWFSSDHCRSETPLVQCLLNRAAEILVALVPISSNVLRSSVGGYFTEENYCRFGLRIPFLRRIMQFCGNRICPAAYHSWPKPFSALQLINPHQEQKS